MILNVRTLFSPGQLDILLHHVKDLRLSVMGLSETRWTGSGEFSKEDIKLINAGRKDGLHQEGVGLMLRGNAIKALLGYNPMGSRIITASSRRLAEKPQLYRFMHQL